MGDRRRALTEFIESIVPTGSSQRKVAEILSIILIVEGLFVISLFSYVGMGIGFASVIVGFTLYHLLRETKPSLVSGEKPIGVRVIETIVRAIGGDYGLIVLGSSIILTVLLFNRFVSPRPEIGDIDSLAIIFGLMLITFPVLSRRYNEEASFALIFIALITLILVVPQALLSLSDTGETSFVGNWYVHYMLAAPFAGILDVIGIPASSQGNLVTLQFQDGTWHTLSISSYCAGLYSFSIFLSAFISFVMVFERLPRKVLALVLAIGVVTAYLGNLLRMVVVGVVGYYRGIDALHWTHENAGWIIFLSWSTLFWWLILGYASKYRVTGTTEAN